jgi:hypothetical protein
MLTWLESTMPVFPRTCAAARPMLNHRPRRDATVMEVVSTAENEEIH